MKPESPPRLGWVLAALLIGQFMANVDVAIINVAAPSVREDLHASGGGLEMVVFGYQFAYATLLVTGARLGGTYGHRRMFLLGVAGFTAASLVCGIAPDAAVLIGARILQGAAAALMVPQVLTGIQLHFTGQARVRALGGYTMALSGGAVAGQVLGGVLVSANLFGLHWRPVFLINIPIGVVLLVIGLRVLPVDRVGERRRVDLAGVLTLGLSTLLITVPLALGRDLGWPGWAIVCLVLSAPALVGFVLVQRQVSRRGGAPLVNLSVLARKPVSYRLAALALTTATYLGMLFTLALYLQQGLARSPLFSGVALVPWVAAFGLAGQVFRRLPARVGRAVAPAGALLLTLAYLAISVGLFAGGLSDWLLITLLAVGGFGLGVNFASVVSELTNQVPGRYAPDLTGAIGTATQLAGTIGVAAFGAIYLATATGAGPALANHAFGMVTAVMAGAALLAAVAGWRAAQHRTTFTEPVEPVEPAGPTEPAGERTEEAVAR